MFTGIIESLGTVRELHQDEGNLILTVAASIAPELKVDQSVSHNGVCLTVTEVAGDTYQVQAIEETLLKTNLSDLNVGDRINLERCMTAGGRLDGHIVQGHVDMTGECIDIVEKEGSWYFHFKHPKGDLFTVEKGSICVNGVSLTVVESTDDSFSVAIIPYTYEHTNFKDLCLGMKVNLEFDIIGKYVSRLMERYRN